MNKTLLFTYYRASDLMVMLTRGDVWGLVVNEAMANALPVISTDACVAGKELIKDGENGYIVPVDSPDITEEKIKIIIENSNLYDVMQKECLNTIKNYTYESMAKKHIEIFNKIKQ